MIVSNNHAERVKPFADPLGLDFVSDSGKPLKKGYKAAMKKMGLESRLRLPQSAISSLPTYGAQISQGSQMLYVEPMELEPKSKRFIRFKRVLEKPFLPKKFADDTKEKL